jgi:hypothetical protein
MRRPKKPSPHAIFFVFIWPAQLPPESFQQLRQDQPIVLL